MHVSLKRLAATLALAITFVALLSSNAFATHLRYGTLTWRYPVPTNRNRVEFKLTLGLRRSYYAPTPQIGVPMATDAISPILITGPSGYNQSFSFALTPRSLSLVDDWFIGDAVVTVDLPTTGVYTAQFYECCRLSSIRDGNNDREFYLKTIVDTNPALPLNSSPTTTLLPVLFATLNQALNFQIPAVDADGDVVTFEVSTTLDSGLPTPKPAGLTLSSGGFVQWTPTTIGLYALQVKAVDSKGAKTPLDFIIDVEAVSNLVHTPTLSVNGGAPPAALQAAIGVELRFTLTGTDVDVTDQVTLASSPLPTNATVTPSLPVSNTQTVSTVFSWTPSLGDTSQVLAFQVTDQTGRASYWFVPINIVTGDLLYVSGTLRDFNPTPTTDTDFGRTIDGDSAPTFHIVSNILGPDGKPIYAPNGVPSTTNATNFAQWFNRTPATVYSVTANNVLNPDPGVYTFSDTSFLPLVGNTSRRYFTYELHTYYTHTPGRVLQFSSSDDLWVFINGKLAVDLGGVHAAARTGTFDANAQTIPFGLTAGQTYRMDIFYAHRGSSHDGSISMQLPKAAICDPLGTATPIAMSSLLPPLGRASIIASGTKLRLTNKTDTGSTSGSAWTPTRVSVNRGFETQFDFQIGKASTLAEGFALVLQAESTFARGGDGGNLGYGGISKSLALEFDAHQNLEHGDPSYQHLSLHANTSGGQNGASEVLSLGKSLFDPVLALTLDNNTVQHVRVTYTPAPTSDGIGWFRAYMNANLLPTMEVPVDPGQVANLFPDGTAWLGFTSGSTATSEADVDISNWNVRLPAPGTANAISLPVNLTYGFTGEMKVQMRDACLNPLYYGGSASSFTAVMTKSGSPNTPVTIIDNADGTYSFRYLPTAGTWALQILLNGTPIVNSPFQVVVSGSSIATPTMTVTGGTFTYDGAAHPAVVTVTAATNELLGPVTVTYNGAPGLPVLPGTYAVAASFAGNSAYLPVSGTATITITGTLSSLCSPFTVVQSPVAAASLTLGGLASLKTGGILSLMQPLKYDFSSSAWTRVPFPLVHGFTADFDLRIPQFSEGLAFVMQSQSATARGGAGGNLAYDFAHSIAVEFDTTRESASPIFDPSPNHIELHSNGANVNGPYASLTLPANISNIGSIVLADNTLHHASFEYQRSAPTAGILKLWLDQTDHTLAPRFQWTIQDAVFLGALPTGSGWVGFTSGSGGSGSAPTASDVEISNFKLGLPDFSGVTSLVAPPAAMIVGDFGSVTALMHDVCGNPAHSSAPGTFTATMTQGATSIGVSIIDNGDGTYRFSYAPNLTGTWSLAISYDGTPISGSPFSVTVTKAATSLSAVSAPIGIVANSLTASTRLTRTDNVYVGAGQSVDFLLTQPDGSTSVLNGSTDAGGVASVMFTPPQKGNYAISAAYAGDSTLIASASATSTLPVYQRTSISMPSSLNGTATSAFTFNVNLSTVPGGTGVVGEPVTISFTGPGAPAAQTVNTVAGGIATVLVVFPTAGTFTAQASFVDAAAFYADHTGAFPVIAETASASVTITAASTSLSTVTAPAFGLAGDALTAQTTLTRTDGVLVGSGLPVIFTFTQPNGGIQTVPGTTDTIGQASANFTPTQKGLYAVSASFAGTAALAPATSSPAAITAYQRTSLTAPSTLSGPTGSPVTFNLSLQTFPGGAGIGGEQVSVSFAGPGAPAPVQVTTNSAGIATVSVVFPSTGTFTVLSSFINGGGFYTNHSGAFPPVAESAVTTVTSTPAATSLSMSVPSFALVADALLAQATLSRPDGLPVGAGQPIDFTITRPDGGIAQLSGTTDGSGTATVNMPLTLRGVYSVSAAFTGYGDLQSATATAATVPVYERTSLTLPVSLSGAAGATVTFNVALNTYPFGVPVAGAAVNVSFIGAGAPSPQVVITGPEGTASVSVVFPSAGTYIVQASFLDSAAFFADHTGSFPVIAETASTPLDITVATTSVSTVSLPAFGMVGDALSASARISRNDELLVGSGLPVTFTFTKPDGGIATVTGTTDEAGVASVSFTPTQKGIHTVSASFAGTAGLAPAISAPAGVGVYQRTQLSLPPSVSGTAGATLTFNVTLSTFPGGAPLANEPVHVSFAGTNAPDSVDVTTGPGGIATVSVVFPAGGTFTAQASFVDAGAFFADHTGAFPVTAETASTPVTITTAPTTLSAVLAPSFGLTGNVITASSTLSRPDGIAVGAGLPVVFTFTAPGGGTTQFTGTTDGSGVASATLLANVKGNYSISAAFSGSAALAASTSSAATVPVFQRTSLTLPAPMNVAAGATLTFNVTLTTLPPGAPMIGETVNVFFTGPGAPASQLVTTGPGGIATVSVVFPTAGSFTAQAAFSNPLAFFADHTGAFPVIAETASTTINVNAPPVVTVAPVLGTSNEGTAFNGSASFIDTPGDGPWTVTAIYGDGSPSVQSIVPSAGSFPLSHLYTDNGIYSVTVTVSDRFGAISAPKTGTVTVNNVAPSIGGLGGPIGGFEGGTFGRTPLNFNDPGAADAWTATVDYGDGSGVQPLALTINATNFPRGSFSLSHTYVDSGTFTITVVVTDKDGGSTTTNNTVIANVGNQPPQLAPASLPSPEETVPFTFSGIFLDASPNDAPWSATINFGDGTGVQPLPLTLGAPPSTPPITRGTFSIGHVYAAFGTYTITTTVTDKDGGIRTQTFGPVHVESRIVSIAVTPNPATIAAPGLTLSMNGTATFSDGTTQSTNGATHEGAVWASSDPTVATVDQAGLVTAVAPGVTTITVTADDEAGVVTGSATLTVLRIVTSFNNVTPPVTIDYGTASATVSGTVLDAQGHGIPGITVDIGSSGAQVTTGADGTYSFPLPTEALTVGTYTIAHHFAGNATFAPSDGSTTVTVIPRAATITASDRTKTFGDEVTFAGTEFTANGLVNGDAFTVTLTSAGASAAADAGSYDIFASNAVGSAAGDYAFSYVKGTLSTSRRAATFAVTGSTSPYDGLAHRPTGTATGLGGLDLSSLLDFGSGVINAPGGMAHWTFAGNTNYQPASGDVQIIITPLAATIDVSGFTGVYDGLAHGASGTATGLGGANLNSFLNFGSSFTNVPGGTANWTFSGNPNYVSTSGTAAIVISQRSVTVTADAKTKMEGTADPALTYRITLGSLAGADAFSGALTRAPGSTVGVYQIQQGTLTLGSNYTLAYVPANLTITSRFFAPVAQNKTATILVRLHRDDDWDRHGHDEYDRRSHDGRDWRDRRWDDDDDDNDRGWDRDADDVLGTQIILSATDADSRSLTFSVVTPPTHGILSRPRQLRCVSDGHGGTSCTARVVYIPALHYVGPDSFTYKANDGARDSNIATVSITMLPRFSTFEQDDWGASPRTGNTGAFLATNFAGVYGSGGVTIGAGSRKLRFDTANNVKNFLPASGRAGTLAASATNPTSSRGGVFAGEVLALKLNVDFSTAGKTRSGLGALHLSRGALRGQTVAQVLALANNVLGGASNPPSGMSVDSLSDIVANINANYDGGHDDDGYLVP